MKRHLDVLKLSESFPRELRGVKEANIWTVPVCPDGFVFLDETIVICRLAKDAVAFVQQYTQNNSRECTLVLCGERYGSKLNVKDGIIGFGEKTTATFSTKQLNSATKAYSNPKGAVVYAHTHVAEREVYNCFSVSDLTFLIKQSAIHNRDVYGMLITKDGATPIKYSRCENKFFRINVELA